MLNDTKVWKVPRNRILGWGVLALFLVSCGGAKPFSPKTHDDNPQVAFQKGVKFLNQGQCDLAEKEFRIAVKSDERNSVALNALGLAFYCEKLYDDAIMAFQTAIRVNPFYTDVHNNLGIAFMEKGRFDDAMTEFNRALGDKNYQTPEVAYFNRGLVFYGQKQFRFAVGEMRKALQIKPDQTAWRIELSKALEKEGDLEAALAECRRVLDKEPNSIQANFLQARLLLKLNQREKACEYLRMVTELAPESDMGRLAADLLRDNGC